MHRPYAHREGDTLYLYYEQYKALELFRESSILVRRANISHTDTGVLYCTVLYYTLLYCTVLAGVEFSWWPRSEEVLVPELAWEQEGGARVGNPFVWWAGQQYLMYYSGTGSTVLYCTV